MGVPPKGRVDEADGNVLPLIDLAAKEVGHSREVGGGIRGAEGPGGGLVFKRVSGAVIENVEEADCRVGGGGDLLDAFCMVAEPGKPRSGNSILELPE